MKRYRVKFQGREKADYVFAYYMAEDVRHAVEQAFDDPSPFAIGDMTEIHVEPAK
jgi:hypothetical protein